MTSKKRHGRLLPFAEGSRSVQTRRVEQPDPALAALLAHWRAPEPASTLDERVMASADRLLAPRRFLRVSRLIVLAAGLILALALVDRPMLAAAARVVRSSLADVGRAASSLVVVIGRLGVRDARLPGRPVVPADALVPFMPPATVAVRRGAASMPRVDVRARVALEVRALSLLARGQVLAGAQIEVTPSGAGVRISGVTDTPEQRRTVIAALGALVDTPDVTVDIRSATDLARTPSPHAAVPRVRIVDVAPNERAPLPALDPWIQKRLQERLGRTASDDEIGAERREFTNRALTVSREVLVHALTLQRLATRFSAAARRDMASGTQDEWRSLLRDMADLVQRHVHDLRVLLQPLLLPAGGDGLGPDTAAAVPSVATDDATARVAHEIGHDAVTLDEQLRGAFARSTRHAALDGAALGRALERLETLAFAVAGSR